VTIISSLTMKLRISKKDRQSINRIVLSLRSRGWEVDTPFITGETTELFISGARNTQIDKDSLSHFCVALTSLLRTTLSESTDGSGVEGMIYVHSGDIVPKLPNTVLPATASNPYPWTPPQSDTGLKESTNIAPGLSSTVSAPQKFQPGFWGRIVNRMLTSRKKCSCYRGWYYCNPDYCPSHINGTLSLPA